MATGLVTLGLVLSVLAAMASQVLESWGEAYATDKVTKLPVIDVAMVLGTLPYDPPGRLNPDLGGRLEAGYQLWRAGKVRYLIVSGNRESDAYDEPTVMRKVLIEHGVPPQVIYRDFAGFRTVTSIVRARDIYGQRRLIIVSQRDHLDRAIFLARHLGVEAWGYDAVGDAPPPMIVRPILNKLIVLYAYWDLVVGAGTAAGSRVAIGVDPPV
jgi:SanA protein